MDRTKHVDVITGLALLLLHTHMYARTSPYCFICEMISHSPQITVFFKNMMAQLQPALQVINYSDPKVQATIRALLHHINPTIPSPAVSFLY